MKIINLPNKVELGKRCYLPFLLETTCPTCGEAVSSNLTEDYLNYPTLNEFNKIPFYCEKDDKSWEELIFIKIQLTNNS
jgi:hypothetical protein